MQVLKLLSTLLGVLPQGQATFSDVSLTALLYVIKESFKVYKSLQEGVLSLLDKFFEMDRTDATTGLQLYKDFALQFDKLQGFYKSCKQVTGPLLLHLQLAARPSSCKSAGVKTVPGN